MSLEFIEEHEEKVDITDFFKSTIRALEGIV